ncbi:hypothetical protein TanjilG_03562 [Lupinus angustifolius]|uniref:Uncharacterized protein n=1 Tax=Lupinus angustifolius TaxID=3871 RepID=A0A1J7H4G6_LUPAN|nr:PREDICTED: uncharacterized protein LOC109352927 [Lupinus angustifolius]OIW07775.1 hypothetical protein TanjilG_03562 [Lupinus angustifolius]
MSTDLQLPHELPKLQISTAKTILPDRTATIIHVKVESDGDGGDDNSYQTQQDGSGGGGDENSYQTPTSKESKIPAIILCPRAPRKAKQISCKRKLMDEYQFFEVVNKEEMDAFSMSNFPKRSCRCK